MNRNAHRHAWRNRFYNLLLASCLAFAVAATSVRVQAQAPAADPKPKPAPEESDPKPDQPEPEPDKPKDDPKPKPKLKPDDKPDPKPAPKPKPDDKPDPEPKPDPKPAPKTKPEPQPKPKPAATTARTDEESGLEQIELFTRVLEMVRQDYVDSDKTSYERLINSALEGMLADLDPHCQFMHPRVFEQLKQNTGSTYEGVGITISFRNEALTIVTVREDGPAARAGVLPGDQILKINNTLTEKLGISEAINLLKGKPGQKLALTLRRPATRDLIEVEMIREIIKEDTVKDIGMLDLELTQPYKIGYARLLQFSEPTAEELANALDQLEAEGMKAFVLDLRNNPGGLLNSAVDVCGEFLPANTLVLTTEGRPGSGLVKPYRTSENRPRERTYPVAILVNHSSASGSEVVAGALQDLKRAIIVGETTFGKGSVQSVKPLHGGRAIRMTTAKYYTPSKRTIHENGVIPNIVVSVTPEEEEQLIRWWRRDRLPPEERAELEDGFEDLQLVRAVDAMKGALIYGAPEEKKKPEPEPKPEPKAETDKKKEEEAKPDAKPKPADDKKGKEKPEPDSKEPESDDSGKGDKNDKPGAGDKP